MSERWADHQQLWRSLPATLRALGKVDRVELKAVVDSDLEMTMAVLDAEVEPPRLRRIHYLDTPDLSLFRRGVIVRARVNQTAGKGDVVVKQRRPVPHRARPDNGVALELDALPVETWWAESMKRCRSPERQDRALTRRRPVRRLLTKKQRALLARLAGDEIDLDDLIVFGPVDVVRLTSRRRKERICVEAWALPDGSRIIELSAKCRPKRSSAMAALVRQLISDHGIALAAQQVTKTQLSLKRLVRAHRRPPQPDEAEPADAAGSRSAPDPLRLATSQTKPRPVASDRELPEVFAQPSLRSGPDPSDASPLERGRTEHRDATDGSRTLAAPSSVSDERAAAAP